MKVNRTIGLILAAVFLAGLAILSCTRPAAKQEPAAPLSAAPHQSVEEQEAAIPESPLKDAYFGDTHVHTSYSLDAYIGGARLTPDEAYQFAQGKEVVVNGLKHSIGRPLDWAAVSDHAEFIGEMYSTQVAGAPGGDNPMLEELRHLKTADEQRAWFGKYVVKNMRGENPSHPPFYAGPGTTKSAWQAVALAAVRDNYHPGKFTTLAGFEWSAAQNEGNMHRNVIFRDLTVPDMPFSALDSPNEEKLWAWMAEQEKMGSRLLAIPHNSNGSKGLMFAPLDKAGRPLSAEYARLRSHYERLIEMMQIKGNSEVHRKFWPADEFADFENGDSVGTFSGRTFKKENFVRWAVTKGLAYEAKLGENPYRLGFIGGTDNHNGLPGDVAENDYIGSHGPADGTLKERREGEIDGWIKAKESNPGSLAGVWATRNTRAAIWDALAARETFVTSGPRIKPRFFGGATLGATQDPVELVKQGYARGVSMGGTLKALERAPTFTVHAQKDPDGANLDRIQIIKGWVNAKGEPQERIFDVAWSGNRKPNAKGKLPALGHTVDLKKGTYANTIGAPELIGSFTDPSFDPKQPALYYVRVIEIPTPRWTTYDAVRNNLPRLKGVPATVQERAWTSPIWYTATK
ncbi:MAG: DUF3604 domain-containing protein [Desulfobacterales bacterium]|nr:DUF3604 domain-containing protein [Desulfobacterales bacterium]